MSEPVWREDFRLWWPEGESEGTFNYMMQRVTDVDLAVKHVRSKCIAVQAGGFLGVWPTRLAKFFERVYTFEPVPHLYDCLVKNVAHLPHVVTTPCALGREANCEVSLRPARGGCSRVVEGDAGIKVPVLTIDSLALPRVDAIFLDVERHEIPALEGAAATIKKWMPVITVEQKLDNREALKQWFAKRDYQLVEEVHGDYIFAHAARLLGPTKDERKRGRDEVHHR